MVVYTDSIGNKYVGYAGDYTQVSTGGQMLDYTVNDPTLFQDLLTDFSGNVVKVANENNLARVYAWRNDGTNFSASLDFDTADGLGDGFYGFATAGADNNSIIISASQLSRNNIAIGFPLGGDTSWDMNKAVATASSDGGTVGLFIWDSANTYTFIYAGAVLGNSNIDEPQSRVAISQVFDGGTQANFFSYGVKQPDSTTKRLHLDTEFGANHNNACGTDTARLFLIEDDGSGGDGGTVGYCPNLYLTKDTNTTIGQFYSLGGITDGGSEHAIAVTQWGDAGTILMRVYDGVN